MHPGIQFLLMAVVVVAIAVFAYLVGGVVISRRRERCPDCRAKKLRCVQFIRATVIVDGKRAPDFWSYFECESCHSHQKLHRGVLSVVALDEWQHYCTKRSK